MFDELEVLHATVIAMQLVQVQMEDNPEEAKRDLEYVQNIIGHLSDTAPFNKPTQGQLAMLGITLLMFIHDKYHDKAEESRHANN